MSLLARIFVGIVFSGLAGCFLLSTLALWDEFRALDWQLLVYTHSHLFFYFPVFGILALIAFSVPAAAFTDLYWRRLPYGRGRYFLGFVFMVAIAAGIGHWYGSQERRGVWEVAPAVLEQELAARAVVVPDCRDGSGRPCQRLPILLALKGLREAGLTRPSMSAFARTCVPEPLMERPAGDNELRFCFPAGSMLAAAECCKVQRSFAQHVGEQVKGDAGRSRLAYIEGAITGLKAFMVLVMIVIATMLVVLGRQLVAFYRSDLDRIERGVVVGAVAMLLWLLMDAGYQQTSDLMFGREHLGVPFRLSFVVVGWLALIVVFLVRQMTLDTSTLVQPWTAVAPVFTGAAWLSFDAIAGWSAWLLGAGAKPVNFAALVALALAGALLLRLPWHLPRQTALGQPRGRAADSPRAPTHLPLT